MFLQIFFLILAVVAWMGLSSPIHTRYKRAVVSGRYRYRRSPIQQYVKGHKADPQAGSAPSSLEMKVKKGEYVCGDKICKLKPGEIPKGCNGICQYPI
ncbi:unnamed protein product [Parnassius mnemosyne]|uniref:Secreted protein n=1 Tax=Parnassius mnemosyne TaxID=213953 RepID=A0AAV1L714_9NEOP